MACLLFRRHFYGLPAPVAVRRGEISSQPSLGEQSSCFKPPDSKLRDVVSTAGRQTAVLSHVNGLNSQLQFGSNLDQISQPSGRLARPATYHLDKGYIGRTSYRYLTCLASSFDIHVDISGAVYDLCATIYLWVPIPLGTALLAGILP